MSSQSIFLLEDEPLILLDMQFLIEDSGFLNVNASISCAQAMTVLATHTPDLAILDLHLKDGKCTNVCSELVTRGVPIIVCSGAYERDEDKVFEQVIWLPKPFSSQELLAAVSKVLGDTVKEGLTDGREETETSARQVATGGF